jgi:hypothetical protein
LSKLKPARKGASSSAPRGQALRKRSAKGTAGALTHHVDLRGQVYALSGLDGDEQKLLARLKAFAATNPPWHEYQNLWMAEVGRFYDARGLPRSQTIETPVYRVGQDIGSRLGIAQGKMRQSDYRDELEQLILTRFKTRRDFCEATGLSEDMLSHVLARRKHLAIDTLHAALEKVGYKLHIAPLAG